MSNAAILGQGFCRIQMFLECVDFFLTFFQECARPCDFVVGIHIRQCARMLPQLGRDTQNAGFQQLQIRAIARIVHLFAYFVKLRRQREHLRSFGRMHLCIGLHHILHPDFEIPVQAFQRVHSVC